VLQRHECDLIVREQQRLHESRGVLALERDALRRLSARLREARARLCFWRLRQRPRTALAVRFRRCSITSSYGNNVCNGSEKRRHRNSNYDSEPRNDALIFGDISAIRRASMISRTRNEDCSDIRFTIPEQHSWNPSSSPPSEIQRDAGGFSAPNRVMLRRA